MTPAGSATVSASTQGPPAPATPVERSLRPALPPRGTAFTIFISPLVCRQSTSSRQVPPVAPVLRPRYLQSYGGVVCRQAADPVSLDNASLMVESTRHRNLPVARFASEVNNILWIFVGIRGSGFGDRARSAISRYEHGAPRGPQVRYAHRPVQAHQEAIHPGRRCSPTRRLRAR